jgi:hypothetical protein
VIGSTGECERRESNPDPLRDRILSPNDGVDGGLQVTTRGCTCWTYASGLLSRVVRSCLVFRHRLVKGLPKTPPLQHQKARPLEKAWSRERAAISQKNIESRGCAPKKIPRSPRNISALRTRRGTARFLRSPFNARRLR